MLYEAKVNEAQHRLMLAIGDTIANHTKTTPMRVDEIAGVLGFCAGAAIVKGIESDRVRRTARQVAIGNVDNGMEAMRRATAGSNSGLIIPGMVV